MEPEKPALLTAFFDQIESQVQFGDTKASLLISGDSILLAVSGGLVKLLANCAGGEFSFTCIAVSPELVLALSSSALFIIALALALFAARPARIHQNPPRDFFLLSHVARLEQAEFIENYRTAEPADLADAALRTIYLKARLAATKFRLLRWAVDATLLGLAFMSVALFVGIISR